MRAMILMAAGALALGACDKGAAPTEGGAAAAAGAVSEAEAKAVYDKLVESFASRDSARVMQHYAPGAVLFDASQQRPSTDRNLQTQWTASFMTMNPGDFTTSDLHLQPLGPDSFVASGISGFTADVGPGRSVLHVRFSQVFQKQADGQWRIVHEHISSPPPGARP